MIRVAIAGAAGRMGRTLLEAVNANSEVMTVTAVSMLADDPAFGVDVGLLTASRSSGLTAVTDLAAVVDDFDVIIDFTSPEATMSHLELCRANAKALVIGTTGLSEADKSTIAAAAKSIPVIMAPNYSVGVNLCLRLLQQAASIIGDSSDIEIVEAHHRYKKDAPSGTALRMGEVIAQTLNRNLDEVAIYGREGMGEERDDKTIGFATIRGGDVVGDHTVVFASAGERVEITHKASSRMTFATGAIRAAEYIVNKKAPGLFTMDDVLGS